MKYCSKCGKELLDEAVICVGCGCAVEIMHSNQKTKNVPDKEVSCDYLENHSRNLIMYIVLSCVSLIFGVVAFLLINVWIGVSITFLSLVFAIIPHSFVKKEVRKLNLGTAKKLYTKRIIKKYHLLKSTYILMIIAGILLCLETTGIIVLDIFLASIPSPWKPNLNSFGDFLSYLNSAEYALYETTRKLREGLEAVGYY